MHELHFKGLAIGVEKQLWYSRQDRSSPMEETVFSENAVPPSPLGNRCNNGQWRRDNENGDGRGNENRRVSSTVKEGGNYARRQNYNSRKLQEDTNDLFCTILPTDINHDASAQLYRAELEMSLCHVNLMTDSEYQILSLLFADTVLTPGNAARSEARADALDFSYF